MAHVPVNVVDSGKTKYVDGIPVENLPHAIDSINQGIAYYNKLLSAAKSFLSEMTRSKTILNTINSDMKLYFIVKGKTVDDEIVSKSKTKVDNIKKELENKIIPELEKILKDLETKRNKYKEYVK